MITIDPKQATTAEVHGYLVGAVGPRPIAFASTIDNDGNPNLAPFSFFNVFSSNPPIMVFSANRRVRNNSTKDTLQNIQANHQVVINVVNYAMVRQVSLASTEYAKGVNEFEKAGFTALPSERVKPFRVAESPVQFECKVNDIISLGEEGGAGNLFVCEVVLMHIHDGILNDKGRIDVQKIDLCGRLGGPHYVRASSTSIFDIVQPASEVYIGIDQLPTSVRYSKVLTGNELAQLASVQAIPEKQQEFKLENRLNSEHDKHQYVKQLLQMDDVATAWQVLLA